MFAQPDIQRAHYDQFVFTFKTGYMLPDILSGAFGEGRVVHTSKDQQGIFFDGTGIWCSSTKNVHGYSWLALPATEDHLSVLGQLATKNSLRLHLHSAELAFDFACPGLNHARVEILRSRIAHRLAPIYGRSVRSINVSGDFQQCNDGALNGTKSTYLHPLDAKFFQKTGHRQRGKFIGAKNILYTKKLDGVWNIRAEVTLYRGKLKAEIPFLPRELERLCRLEATWNFNHFWDLFATDHAAFREKVIRLARGKWQKEPPCLYSMLNACETQPFVEQRVAMKEIATYIGSKRLAENLKSFFRPLTLQEALAMPTPAEL